MTKTTGAAMFADLTTDELDIARAKLASGATAASRVTGAHDFHSETYEILHEMHLAWEARFSAEHPAL